MAKTSVTLYTLRQCFLV